MAIFERISDLVRANINDLIDRAENPEKMVKQIIIDMEDQLKKSTQSLGTAMGSLNQAKKQLENAKEQSNNWQNKAKTCLEQGNENLAKQALENKVKQDKIATEYQEMCDTMEVQVNETKSMEQKISAKEAQSNALSDISGIEENDAFTQMENENNVNAELEKLKQELNNN